MEKGRRGQRRRPRETEQEIGQRKDETAGKEEEDEEETLIGRRKMSGNEEKGGHDREEEKGGRGGKKLKGRQENGEARQTERQIHKHADRQIYSQISR